MRLRDGGGVAVDALFEIASIAPKYFILTKENADEGLSRERLSAATASVAEEAFSATAATFRFRLTKSS